MKNLQISDEELVIKTISDSTFFAELISRYEGKLGAYLKRFGFEGKDIEDFLQEIFISVYKNLNAFDPKLKFSSWIYRIAHNYAVSVYRKKKILTFELTENLAQDLRDESDLVQELDKKVIKELVAKAISKMDYKYREILVLRYFEDKDYEEISDILKKPSGTVATLINRAKKQFKEKYNELNI